MERGRGKIGGVVDDIMEVVYLCEDSDVGEVEKHLVVLRGTFPSLRFSRGLACELGVWGNGNVNVTVIGRKWRC